MRLGEGEVRAVGEDNKDLVIFLCVKQMASSASALPEAGPNRRRGQRLSNRAYIERKAFARRARHDEPAHCVNNPQGKLPNWVQGRLIDDASYRYKAANRKRSRHR